MNTNRIDHFACDGCGRFFRLDGERLRVMLSAHLGGGEWVDFCDGACFVECMARGGVLAHRRGQLLLIFGMTPAQHFEEAVQRIRHMDA